jgi:putative toxin-antitoxin system antitoxin component (TIGR02293 family)
LFRALYAASALERIHQVREGVSGSFLSDLSDAMQMPREKLYASLRLPRATMLRKLKLRLTPDESERVLGVARLIGQVETIVRESGEPENFNAAQWFAHWLEQPNPALGGKLPAEFLDTADGRMLIGDLLARMQSGAYS